MKKVIIEVSGGCVTAVHSNIEDIEVTIIDHDSAEDGSMDDDALDEYGAKCDEADSLPEVPTDSALDRHIEKCDVPQT